MTMPTHILKRNVIQMETRENRVRHLQCSTSGDVAEEERTTDIPGLHIFNEKKSWMMSAGVVLCDIINLQYLQRQTLHFPLHQRSTVQQPTRHFHR
jgi:hypothetical protein